MRASSALLFDSEAKASIGRLQLSLRLRRENLAGTTGLEPATSAVTGQRSNQLNYVPRDCVRLVGSVRFERTTFRV